MPEKPWSACYAQAITTLLLMQYMVPHVQAHLLAQLQVKAPTQCRERAPMHFKDNLRLRNSMLRRACSYIVSSTGP